MPPLAAAEERAEWLRLLLFLVLLALGLAALRWDAWREVDRHERARMATQLQAVERNLARQFAGMHAALLALRRDAAPGQLQPAVLSREMQALADAMPGARTLLALDATGRAYSASRPELVGRDFGQRAYFQRARAANDPQTLHVSPPFDSVLGVRSLNLSVSLQDAQGGFAGIVAATLDPDYFAVALGASRYAPDMWASVAHQEGSALLYEPPQTHALDMDLSRPGTMFSRHLASGEAATVFAGRTAMTGESLLFAMRTLSPPDLAMDRVLVLGLTRDQHAVHAAWRETTRAYALLWLALAAMAGGGLRALHRRRRAARAERESAERQRRRDQQRLELALRGADLGTWELDLADGSLAVNARWRSMLGWDPDESRVARQAFVDLVHPQDLPALQALEARHLAGEIARVESLFRMRHRQGHWIWVLSRGQITERDAQGQALRLSGTHLDVTERMQSEQALQARERQLSALADALPGPVCQIDSEGIVRFANAACRSWLGAEPAALLGRPAAQALGVFAAGWGEHEAALAQGRMASFETAVAQGGQTRYALVTLVPDRDADGFSRGAFLVASDITAPRSATEALRRSELRLRTLLDALATGVVVHDANARIVMSNPAASALLGLTPAQMQGLEAVDPVWHFVEDDGSPMPPSRYPVSQVLASGQPVSGLVGGIVRPDRDEPVWVLVDALPMRDETGALSQVVVTFFDVSALRRTTQRLSLLQAGVERLNDVVLIIEVGPTPSDRARIAYANPAFERVTGYTLAEVLGRSPRLLQGPGTDPEAAARLVESVLARKPLRTELQHYTRSGKPYWVEIDIAPVPDASGRVTHMVSVERDVTQRRELEAQLREAQKLEAIGTLAGGIAHDFNNIVAGILGNVALLRQDLGADHPAAASLAQIERAGLRGRSLVRQILTFSRRGELRAEPVRLNDVVRETLELLRATAPAGVRWSVRLAEVPVWVRGDGTQLQQVLMNLCVNAWQALPDGGGLVEVSLHPQGDMAVLAVRDEGCGIDEALQARIFDPFFTTKPQGVGTGLGLAVVRGIVQGHGGGIECRSGPGRGTVFEVRLPLLAHEGADAMAGAPAAAQKPGTGQMLLYVDDDEIMRLVVQRLLERAGWQVVACDGGAAALAELARRDGRVDLVISDMNMPDMTGLELCTRLQTLHPGLPTMISTGLLTEDLRARAVAAGVRLVMPKERLTEELVPRVAQVLAAAAAA